MKTLVVFILEIILKKNLVRRNMSTFLDFC